MKIRLKTTSSGSPKKSDTQKRCNGDEGDREVSRRRYIEEIEAREAEEEIERFYKNADREIP